MYHTLTIGRIATIPVRLHWSWLLVVGLLIATLSPIYAAGVCSGAASCTGAWGLGLLMAALFSASLLLHELGHALMARRCAVPVESITLFAFGGMAEVLAESPGPGEEFAIAVAGPAVSLLIALISAVVWWSVGHVEAALNLSLGLTGVLALHLALSNVIMMIFNLLPGYPMDGGRVLRATLWFLSDELLPATRLAALVGRAVASLIIVVGLALAAAWSMPMIAVWSAMIGFFLHSTARASYRQLLMQTALHGVRVSDLMQRRLRTASAELSLEQFVARYLLGQSESGFAVVLPEPEPEAAPQLLGLLTLQQVRRHKSSEWARLRVAEVMSPLAQLNLLAPDMPALDALYRLNKAHEELLPVAEQGRLVGMLSRRDVAIFVQVQLARKRR